MTQEPQRTQSAETKKSQPIEGLLAERAHVWDKLRNVEEKIWHYCVVISLLIVATSAVALLLAKKLSFYSSVEPMPLITYPCIVFSFAFVIVLICLLVSIEKILSISRPYRLILKKLEFRVSGGPFPIHPIEFSISREELMERIRVYESLLNAKNKVFIEIGNVLYAALAFFISGIGFAILAYFLCGWPKLSTFLTPGYVSIGCCAGVLLFGWLYYQSKKRTGAQDMLRLCREANDVRPTDVH